MCGIAGVFTTSNHPTKQAKLHGQIERMVTLQHNRGPDHAATAVVEHPQCRAVLGHNRLAVIDPSPEANQPMASTDGRWHICYNGEIYNYRELRDELTTHGYRFRTGGDTEVILAAVDCWGIEALNRLNGMFAFALFDRKEGRLLLARDRFGIKPLYYASDNDSVWFASTDAALASILSLRPEPTYLATALRYWVFDHDDIAPYQGMKALRPGHVLEIDVGESGCLRSHLHGYYNLEERVAAAAEQLAGRSEQETIQGFADLLDDAVRLRLRSDVPLAVSLSGGLDSATIASIAAQHLPNQLHAFTFGRPEMPKSEGPLVARLAEQIGIEVHYVWPDDREMAEALTASLHAQGTPLVNLSVVAQHLVFRHARREGFKVVLGGQGGDELLMGYRKFQVFSLLDAIRKGRFTQAAWQAVWMMPTLLAEVPTLGHYWRYRKRYTRQAGLDTILRLTEPERLQLGQASGESLAARQMRDVTLGSLPSLLRYEDRNSMAASVESRLPLLDYRLVELALALPETLKLRHGRGKWILRHVTKDIPREIRWARYKHGFSAQQNEWIDRGLGRVIRRMLQSRQTEIRPWLTTRASLADLFSDERLKHRGATLAEATALVWLAECERPTTNDGARDDTMTDTAFFGSPTNRSVEAVR